MPDYIFHVYNAEGQNHERVQSGIIQTWQKGSSVAVKLNYLDAAPNYLDYKNP